jgi:hypothetical protein
VLVTVLHFCWMSLRPLLLLVTRALPSSLRRNVQAYWPLLGLVHTWYTSGLSSSLRSV